MKKSFKTLVSFLFISILISSSSVFAKPGFSLKNSSHAEEKAKEEEKPKSTKGKSIPKPKSNALSNVKDSVKNADHVNKYAKEDDYDDGKTFPVSSVKSISSKVSASDFELSIIAEINYMRSNPREYCDKYIIPRMYDTGDPHWSTLVIQMSNIESLPQLSYAEGLYQCSKAHSSTQGPAGERGHGRVNGDAWITALEKYGKFTGYCGENIMYYWDTPREIVFRHLLDEHDSTHGHRANLLDPSYQVVGVSFDEHSTQRFVTVMNFASGWKDY